MKIYCAILKNRQVSKIGTMTEWELGHRNAPPYVLRLLSYYVEMQHKLNENGISEK